MLLAVTTFSIRPGGTPRVKNTVAQALQTPPLATGAPITLATEIGEVNTLTCFFVSADPLADLQALRGWICGIETGESGQLLRSVTVELFSSEQQEAQLRGLAAPAVHAVLLQEIIDAAPAAAAQQLRLAPLTGRHGVQWLLTPVSDPDDAVRLSLAAVERPEGRLLRSRMLLPVR